MGAAKLTVVGGKANTHPLYGFIPWHEMEVGDVIEVECSRHAVYSINKLHPETRFTTKGSCELPEGWTRITRIR